PDDVERLKAAQRDIHQQFIALVKERRGSRLTGPENDLFSGDFWIGRKALELGVADGLGDLRSTLRRRFGDDVVTPLVSPPRSWLGRVPQGVEFSQLCAPGLAEQVLAAIEDRAIWARYGL